MIVAATTNHHLPPRYIIYYLYIMELFVMISLLKSQLFKFPHRRSTYRQFTHSSYMHNTPDSGNLAWNPFHCHHHWLPPICNFARLQFAYLWHPIGTSFFLIGPLVPLVSIHDSIVL